MEPGGEGGGIVMFEMTFFKRQLWTHTEVNQVDMGRCVCVSVCNKRLTRLEWINETRKSRQLKMTQGQRYCGGRSEFRVNEAFVLLLCSPSSGAESWCVVTPGRDGIGWVKEPHSIETPRSIKTKKCCR